MRLKSFQAKSMSDAMRQIKETLGDDAIIVSSREEPSGWVRITAAIEQVNPQPENILETLEREIPEGYDEETVAETITDALLRHRVPASVSDRVISTAMTMGGGDPQKLLAQALEKSFPFHPLFSAQKHPVMLVGPPGAGKTLMTAKLAAQSVMAGRKPAIITTDIARAGGIEQLSAFLDILSLPLLQADDPKSLRQALLRAEGADEIIIDTGGLNPFDPQEMKHLARLMSVTETESALVLPAGIDAEESAEIAMTFEVLGVHKFIPTRLDFARRLGGLLSAAERAGLAFTEASHTPQVAHGIMHITPETLATLLIPSLPKEDKVKDKKKTTSGRGKS